MIITILRTAHPKHVRAAMHTTADHLHVPVSEVSELIAVAYVCAHFQQGSYSGWDGFTEMLDADEQSAVRVRKG